MSEKTPGQIAYETFNATRWPLDPGTGWDHPAAARARPAWDAAAKSVVAAAELTWDADLTAERDEARAENDQLRQRIAAYAAEIEAEADVTSPSKTSETKRAVAARLREIGGDGQ